MTILEGPDGSGKSTLMRHLVEQWGMELAPRASDSIDGLNVNIANYVREMAMTAPEFLVFDRHPMISELVYGPLLRGGVDASMSGLMLRDKLWFQSQLVIICLPSLETVRTNVIKAGQMKGVAANITAIYNSYQAMSSLIPNAFVYDYEKEGSLEALFRLVLQFHRARKAVFS